MTRIKNFFRNNISYINFSISLSAFIFQISVLHPWHIHIDKKINTLYKKIDLK